MLVVLRAVFEMMIDHIPCGRRIGELVMMLGWDWNELNSLENLLVSVFVARCWRRLDVHQTWVSLFLLYPKTDLSIFVGFLVVLIE